MANEILKLRVNGTVHKVETDPEEPLLWVLRDKLKLMGTKFGCGTGICGACTVLIDSEARKSCIIPVEAVSTGQKIVTIEGLARKGKLTPLQKAFIENNAFGCGFCTPGMILTATALLLRNPSPTREAIIAAMDGNLCRCGSYMNVIEAIESVAGSETPALLE